MDAIRDYFFGNYKELEEAWAKAVAGTKKPKTIEGADFLIGVLEKQLDRASSALKSNEDKAALIIPAIGGIAALTGVKLNTARADDLLLLSLTAALILLGAAAVGFAVLCLNPRSRSDGPPPAKVVAATAEPLLISRLNYMRSLGFAVHSTEQAAMAKAFFLNWSLRFLGVAVLLVVVFGGLGGFEAPQAGGD